MDMYSEAAAESINRTLQSIEDIHRGIHNAQVRIARAAEIQAYVAVIDSTRISDMLKSSARADLYKLLPPTEEPDGT